MEKYGKKLLLGLVVIITFLLGGCAKTQESAFKGVEMKYNGANGSGIVSNVNGLEGNIQYLSARKAGYSESQSEEIRDDIYFTDKANKFDKEKVADYNKYRDVTITISKQENLSNGDKVVVKVEPTEKNGPIKFEEKEFSVIDLPSKYYSVDDILQEVKDYPIKFVQGSKGIQIFSIPTFSDHKSYSSEKYIFQIEKTDGTELKQVNSYYSDLKEGQDYIVKLTPEYIEYKKEQGFILKGENSALQKIACTPKYQ